MRKVCLDMVYELAKQDPRVFFIGSDLGLGTMKKMRDEIPDRFFMEGISEQNILGMAAGLALEGKIVYINTMTTFMLRRALDQVILDLCLHKVNVRLLGNGGGFVYAPLGPTHMAIEDLSVARAIPNFTTIAPCDANEMKRAMLASLNHQGPMYIRIAKGGDPIVSRDDVPFEIGKAAVMREGTDALIITTGITLKLGLEAATELASQGIQSSVVHVHTIKPFDEATVLKYLKQCPAVVVIEENTILGGLGGAVAEILAEASISPTRKFKRIGLPDVFPEEYGSQASMMESFSITTKAIVETILKYRK